MRKIDEINQTIKTSANSGEISSKDVSDRWHTFRTLYKHRIYLFSVLCNQFPEISWKTKKHYDEENDPMFNGDFMAGINTPEGIVSYHIKLEYWNLFNVPEIEHGPKYDGYTDEDVLERLLSLNTYINKPVLSYNDNYMERTTVMEILTLKPCDDVNEFIERVNDSVSRGENARINMYGYEYCVYAFTPKDMLRIAIKRCLQDIKDRSKNIETIKSLQVLSSEEIEELSHKYPDVIAASCKHYLNNFGTKKRSSR